MEHIVIINDGVRMTCLLISWPAEPLPPWERGRVRGGQRGSRSQWEKVGNGKQHWGGVTRSKEREKRELRPSDSLLPVAGGNLIGRIGREAGRG